MENRLELNKKPTYELPDRNILIKSYKRNYSKIDFEEYMKNTLVRKDGNKYNLSATTLKKYY